MDSAVTLPAITGSGVMAEQSRGMKSPKAFTRLEFGMAETANAVGRSSCFGSSSVFACRVFCQAAAVEFTLKEFNPFLPQTVPAAPGCLEMFLRSNADQLHWMLAAANFDRALVAAVMNFGVIKAIPEALLRAFKKLMFSDPSSHAMNLWAESRRDRCGFMACYLDCQ